MRILFLLPLREKGRYAIEEPGVLQIASLLQKEGHTSKIIQPYIGDNESIIPIMEDFVPDLVATTVYDDLLFDQLKMFEEVLRTQENVLSVIGGYAPSYHGIEIMERFSFIDFAIQGEGERAFVELSRAINDGSSFSDVSGLIYRSDGQIICNKRGELVDLEELPFSALDISKDYSVGIGQITSSRGCMGNCSFCIMPDFWRGGDNKRRWRGKDTTLVVDEIEYLHNNFGCTRFVFNDNSFEDPTGKGERAESIADEIINRDMCIYYQVYFRVGFYKNASENLMKKLVKSGLYCVWLGVESGNDEDLILYNKKATVKDNKNAISFFQQFGLNVGVGFIHFNPYSTFDRLHKNIKFLDDIGYAYDITRFFRKLIVYKGSKLYKKIESDGLLTGGIFQGGYGYHFVDNRIETLQNYLELILVRRPELLATNLFSFKLKHVFVILRRETKGRDTIAWDITCKYEEKLNRVLLELNHLVIPWMKEMTLLAENGWDLFAADKICDEYLDQKGIVRNIHELETLRNKCFYKLIKHNNDYSELLKNAFPI